MLENIDINTIKIHVVVNTYTHIVLTLKPTSFYHIEKHVRKLHNYFERKSCVLCTY